MKISAEKVVTEHINRWDPELLLAGGAPDDEYEVEINEIVEAVLESRDEIDIAEAIKEIFDRMFDRNFNFNDCLIVANNIWKDTFE